MAVEVPANRGGHLLLPRHATGFIGRFRPQALMALL